MTHHNKVSILLIVLIIVIYSLYQTRIVSKIPCEKNLTETFIGNFVHISPLHLLSNIYGLYAVSLVEKRLGTKKFCMLISFILILNTLIETLERRILNTSCSIGISGLLFGIFSYELLQKDNVQPILISSLLLSVITDSNKNASIAGHLTGIISGIAASIFL